MFAKLKTITKSIFNIQSSQDYAHYLITFLFVRIQIRKPVPKNPFKNASRDAILIFEPQTHHGECLPSYIKYLNDLGFHVDLLLQHDLIKVQPLCRMPKNSDYSVIPYAPKLCKAILQNKNLFKYKHVIISTSVFKYLPQKSIIQEFPIFKKLPSVFIIEHDVKDIDIHQERPYLQKNRILTLWNFGTGQAVNPCYFGNIHITQKNDDKSATFIVVGALEKERKNHLLLFESIKQLIDLKKNFHVIIIGKKQDSYTIDETIKPYITLTGFIPYSQMYQELEKADFLLTLLDPQNKEHHRYITSGVTGSIQLILGFAKVPIIQKKFADFYNFDDRSALVYTNDLTAAMLDAIQMSKQKYKTYQEVLTQKQQDIFQKSEHNLSSILKTTNND